MLIGWLELNKLIIQDWKLTKIIELNNQQPQNKFVSEKRYFVTLIPNKNHDHEIILFPPGFC